VSGLLDDDDLPDLAVVLQLSSTLIWLKNLGDGGFSAPVTLETGLKTPGQLALADFNSDGRVDFAVQVILIIFSQNCQIINVLVATRNGR